jgi:hypothetical protein
VNFFSKFEWRVIYAGAASFLLLIALNRCSLIGGGGSGIIRADNYDINSPKDWRALKKGQADHTFELPSGNRVAITSSCRRWVNAPLKVMAKQLLIGNRNLRLLHQEPVAITSGEGLLTKAQASENGTELFLTLVLVRMQECLFDVVHIGKKEIPPDEQTELIQLAKGLHYGNETNTGAH